MHDHSHAGIEAITLEVMGGHPKTCAGSPSHSPKPRRLVWHHILPQVCGGQTNPSNLAGLCDNCHYAIHILMWEMAHGRKMGSVPKAQLAIAVQGYTAAVQAGTADKLPDLYSEGPS